MPIVSTILKLLLDLSEIFEIGFIPQIRVHELLWVSNQHPSYSVSHAYSKGVPYGTSRLK
jgi:hypothetical protein